MRKGYLSEYFEGVASKRLSAVEAEAARSNQHEFNGSAAVSKLLGRPDKDHPFETRFLFLTDESEPISAQGRLTWYDARERHPTRSELRLYYTATEVTTKMAEGDLLVLALLRDRTILAIVARSASSVASQLEWLFGLDRVSEKFDFWPEEALDRKDLELAARTILETIGIEEAFPTDQNSLEAMLERFGGVFPQTRAFSAFARESSRTIRLDAQASDEVLIAWIEREEVLFRTLEKHLVQDRIRKGFTDVDDFMAFSLSVQNRRKARAGSALENHLQRIFEYLAIDHTRGGTTERTSRPDFVFPGIAQYKDEAFPTQRLTMLAAKSTCKDRWRQIVREADRIRDKHLLTLEPAISSNQTEEMREASVLLVIPASLQSTYQPAQRRFLTSLRDFILLTEARQSAGRD